MTLPASGAISFSQINTELGRPSTDALGLGDSAVRTLSSVASGAISMSNLYGKTNATWNVIISPSSRATSTKNLASGASFAASASSGTPTAYSWGILSELEGTGTVVTGSTSSSATLQVYVNDGSGADVTFYCDVTVGGVTKRGTVRYIHTYVDPGHGGTA